MSWRNKDPIHHDHKLVKVDMPMSETKSQYGYSCHRASTFTVQYGPLEICHYWSDIVYVKDHKAGTIMIPHRCQWPSMKVRTEDGLRRRIIWHKGAYHCVDDTGKLHPLYPGIVISIRTGRPIATTPPHHQREIDNRMSEWSKHRRAMNRASAAARRADERVKQAMHPGHPRKLDSVMDDVLRLRNVATRTAAIQAIGIEKILNRIGFDVIDEETINGHKYALLKVQIPNPRWSADTTDRWAQRTTDAYYLRMSNPSTDEVCIEGVRPWGMTTVRQALAWRDGERHDPTKGVEYMVPTKIA
jgi:hypothetical protein